MSQPLEYMDKLYAHAVDLVLAHKKPSTSFIQRKLQLGYDTAAQLMKRMEREKVVSEPNFAGKRDILLGRTERSTSLDRAALISAWTEFAPRERPRMTHWEAFQAGWSAREGQPRPERAPELRAALEEIRAGLFAARDDIGVDDWIDIANAALARE